MQIDMFKCGNIESEDSLSDEFTLVIEEVHTDDIAVESPNVPMLKNSIPNSDVLDEESTVLLDDDLDNIPIPMKTHEPCAVSPISEREKAVENKSPSLKNNDCKVNEELNTADAKSSSDKKEGVNNSIPKPPSQNGRVTFVCNGTIVHRSGEDFDKILSKKTVSEPLKENGLKEATNNHTSTHNHTNNKSNSEKFLNGDAPSTQSSPLPSSSNNVNRSLSEKNITEGNTSCETVKESGGNVLNSRKRSSEIPEVNDSASKNHCDKVHLVSDIKKRKISDSIHDDISSGIKPAIENVVDHQYSISANPRNNNCTARLPQSSPPSSTNNDKLVTTAKKNIARKHTTPFSVTKTMKDIESTLLTELSKQGKSIPNGCIKKDTHADERRSGDQSPSTEAQYKVNLSVDSMNTDTLKNIFKTMKKTLTRRQLEEIVLQKVCEMISDSSEIGELKRQIHELQAAENHRKLACFSLEKQLHQVKGVCQMFLEKANGLHKDAKVCLPTVITRSVGLQVTIEGNAASRLSASPAQSSIHHSKNSDTKPSVSSLPAYQDHRKSASIAKSSLSTNKVQAPSSVESSTVGRNCPSIGKGLGKIPVTSVPIDSIIDLTDKEDKSEIKPAKTPSRPATSLSTVQTAQLPTTVKVVAGAGLKSILSNRLIVRHPAPLPKPPNYTLKPGVLQPPPKPELTISKNKDALNVFLMGVSGIARIVYLAKLKNIDAAISWRLDFRQCGRPLLPFKAKLTYMQKQRLWKSIKTIQKTCSEENQIRHITMLIRQKIDVYAFDCDSKGISLSWNMLLDQKIAKIVRYQIYAYQETNTPLLESPWKLVGDVNALPLPMECTLTQFYSGFRYHFTVRAVDEMQRIGPFSEASSIAL